MNGSHNKTDQETINLFEVFHKIKSHKNLFIKVFIVTFILSSLLIVCVPRSYTCVVKVVPESENTLSGGTLGALASSFGVDLGSMSGTDAISVLVYPDLFESPQFLVTLLPVQVKSIDGEIATTYYDYMMNMQKHAWWETSFFWIVSKMPKFGSQQESGGEGAKIDVFRLTKKQEGVLKKIAKNIDCSLDKKTNVITLSFRDQDPLICATMADSLSVKLQEFIVDYRTRKARIDVEYYQNLRDAMRISYDSACLAYAAFVDANRNVLNESHKVKEADLQNDMNMKYNTYSALHTQYQAALAKVQERTPAFSTFQHASVPLKATSPKRMLFVIGMCFLAMMCTLGWIFKDDIKQQLTHIQ